MCRQTKPGWCKAVERFNCAIATSITCALSLSLPAIAQSITPDSTLSTSVAPAGNTFIITTTNPGGDQVGGNLFYSFSAFSVGAGETALFANPASAANIISRVTGPNASQINGLIEVANPANLFLLNPNGIIFGPGAQLNIGGSFLGSTAESLQFADGTAFLSSSTQPNPLLTMSAPV